MADRKIPPDWHYVSERQSELWRSVAAVHAPSGEDEDPVAQAYQEMFEETAAELSGNKIHLVGLGAGSGQKERRFAQAIKTAGCAVDFTAVDVSEALASEAVRQLAEMIDGNTEVLVGDLRQAEILSRRLSESASERRPVFTGFGLSPNMLPNEFFGSVRRLLGAGKRGNGIALVSANLWPSGSDAERDLLRQYDNDETRQWLGQLFVEWGLAGEDFPKLEFGIGEVDGIATVQVFATWPDLGDAILYAAPLLVKDWKSGDRIEVFSSLRYRSDQFAECAKIAGMQVQGFRSSSCGREAIFSLVESDRH